MRNKMDDIRFFVEAEIEKGKDSKGNDTGEMFIKGVASTKDIDSDGETLDPNGFDISYFMSKGHINWNHQVKNNPLAIIGEPVEAEIKDDKFIIKAKLYKDSEVARGVYKLAQIMEKSGGTRRLGFSIEGKVDERDSVNSKLVKKARITNVAVAPTPKNPKTLLDIVKGESDGMDMEYDKGIVLDISDGDSSVVVKSDMTIEVTGDYKMNEFEKSIMEIQKGHELGFITDEEYEDIKSQLSGIEVQY